MPITKHFDQLNRMHTLIKFRRTGTPDEFANRIGVSRSQMFKLLSQLRDLGAPIYFSKLRQTYAYRRSVELRLGYTEVGSTSKSVGSHEEGASIVPIPGRKQQVRTVANNG